jgi:hypothetical protein
VDKRWTGVDLEAFTLIMRKWRKRGNEEMEEMRKWGNASLLRPSVGGVRWV